MSFTKQRISKMAQQLRRAAADMLAPTLVTLVGSGDEIMVRLHVGTRRVAGGDLTAGASQEIQSATIDAEDWDELVGRPPRQGDVIVWAGRRFAIEDSKLSAPGGIRVFYKANLKG